MRPLLITALAVTALCLSGCMLHEVREDVPAPVPMPEKFSDSGEVGATPDRWWEAFEDAELTRLVDRALRENLDVRRAWFRLDQSRALAREAGAPLWPEVSIDAGRTRSRNLAFPTNDKAVVSHSSRYNVAADASYEIDLWGKIRSRKSAAKEDVSASREDLESTAFVLSADVADLWYSIAELKARRKLLDEQLKVGQTFLDLVELRFNQGQATAVDVHQQRQQVAATRSEIPLVESSLATSQHGLAVLLGEAPRAKVADVRSTLPALPALPGTGLPGELLTRRPDVRAAQHRVRAADYRVGAAIADRFPSFRLSGQMGLLAATPQELFANWMWSIVTSLATPVIDGGRRRAEVDRTEAVTKELVLSYGRVILNAMREVEDALSLERHQRDYLKQIADRIEIARENLRESRRRFLNGLSDYLPVLTALQSLQSLERTQIQAQRDLISYRIQLYLALGGGAWTKDLKRNTKDLPDRPAEWPETAAVDVRSSK